MSSQERRLQALLRHIGNVRDNCELLGQRLAERGEEELGLRLVANGQVHDHSKFFGIEWQYLNDGAWPREGDDAMFQAALLQHVTTNLHHPEAWPGGIESMDRLHLAEMCADWGARSAEQGGDLMEWVKDSATRRFGFSLCGRVYKELRGLIGLLLDKRFS